MLTKRRERTRLSFHDVIYPNVDTLQVILKRAANISVDDVMQTSKNL